MSIAIVVGLGNPGPKYERHRHNAGFMVVDLLARRWGAPAFREKHGALLAEAEHAGRRVFLAMPQGFMNRSGDPVQRASAFYKIPLDATIVVHDEMDLPFGDVRIKVGGGAAGHNGLRSVAEKCGGPGFVRVRVGIGRPPADGREHVLADFSADERAALGEVLERAAIAVEGILADGPEKTMNRLHTKPKPAPKKPDPEPGPG